MAKKITIEKLAEMTQQELHNLEGKIDGVVELSKAILGVVENIQGRIGEVHTVARVDVPDMRERMDKLEERVDMIAKKVGMPTGRI